MSAWDWVCPCGGRVSFETRDIEADPVAGVLSVLAECDDCTSSFTLSCTFEPGELLQQDGTVIDQDLSEQAAATKADDALADREG